MSAKTPSAHVAVAVLLAALSAGSAAAQQQVQDTEFDSYAVPGWSFTPSIAIGAVHDSNLALSAPRVSLGETQGDTLFSIVPAGQLEFFGKRTDFSAGYRGTLRRYAEVTGLDNYDQRASVDIRHAWNRRLTTFASGNFADTPTTDDVDLNGVPFRRTGSRRSTVAVGSDFRLAKFTTWHARYDTTRATFDDTDIFLTNGRIHELRNEVSQQLSRRLHVGGEHSFRAATLEQGNREFLFNDFGGVVRFAFGAHTTGSAAAGLGMLQDKTADDTRTGPYLRLGISHELERLRVGANFERQYVPSFGVGGTSSNQQVSGYVHMPLARNRLYAQVSGGWRRSVPFELASLQLDTLSLRSTVGYAISRWARVEGLYAFTHQDTNAGGEVDRHRVGVQFVISQLMRIR